MYTKEALARLRVIVAGIEHDDVESKDGWWETSSGAEFGGRKLAELEALISEITAP